MLTAQIIKSLKTLWTRTDLIVKNSIYFSRVQYGTATPYMVIKCDVANIEVVEFGDNVVTYNLNITIWGDELVLHAEEYQRAVMSLMSGITSLPDVPGFLHILPGGSVMMEDKDTRVGKDILITNSNWTMLVQESR